MSVVPQLTVAPMEEADIIAARQQGERIADLLGFEKQDQTRIATVVSKSRNALMDGGGLVESAVKGVEATPGQYVWLAVCNTSIGMSKETLARVLEPFFTIKEVGKGTGLGLSMVYAFAKQSSGHLRIEPSLSRGTTMTMFPPPFDEPLATEDDSAPGRVEGACEGEALLLMDDNEGVRAFSAGALAELGYRVLAACDAASAAAVLDGGARIDLLLTDVVSTGPLTEADDAAHCRRARPGTPVLVTSGYACAPRYSATASTRMRRCCPSLLAWPASHWRPGGRWTAPAD